MTLLLLLQAEPLLDDARLRELLRKAVPAVEQATGLKFKEAPLAKISTRDEVEKVLADELLDQMKILAPEATPEEAADNARRTARSFGDLLIGKYAWKARTIHIMPDTLEKMSKLLSKPEMRDLRFLRVILTHELVHALDQQEFGAMSNLGKARTPADLEILNALVEGHAQHVTRGLYLKAGELADFEAYEHLILAGPESMGQGEKYLAQILTASLRLAYVDGRQFFDGLEKLGKPTYVADVFRSPPATKSALFKPERFYAPKEALPAFDTGPAFDAMAVDFGDGWIKTRADVDEGMIRAAFGDFVPKEDVDAALKGMVECKALVLQPKAAPQSKMVILSLVRAVDAESARRLRDVSLALSKAKDVRLAEGDLRITKAAYSTLKLEDCPGHSFSRKTVVYLDQTIEVASLVGDIGSVQFEIILSGEARDDAAILAMAARVIGGLKAR